VFPQIETLRKQFEKDFQSIQDLKELESVKISYLGKKGSVPKLMADLRLIADEQKKEFGKAVNDLKLGLRQPTNLGVGINTQVAQQLQQPGNLGYTGYNTAITSEQSALGQQKQAEITAEYERLKAERTLLTNPQQST
jgi:phenylalanyl-tRNA synthetase alpha subunit